ncbi:MAG: DUF5777 family beta-barrel protein [Saprospiraceae bacterium]
MKRYMVNVTRSILALMLIFSYNPVVLIAQENTEAGVMVKEKPVKNTFGSNWCMDNQTVMVPIKGTMEMTIQHRFGTVKNGAEDLIGIFAPSNIRLGMAYAPINNLMVGAGITKERMQLDFNAKYGLLKQTPGSMPVSLTYFGNIVFDLRNKSNFRYPVHRMSYFNQLIVARKITDKLSVQVSPTFSWFNNVEAYFDKNGDVQKKMKNGHLAISTYGRYKLNDKFAITAGYDQPLTAHTTNNPLPNICFGFEVTTSAHAFQVFMGNYYGIVPQSNNMFNQNDYTKGQFLIGFNITRLWNY